MDKEMWQNIKAKFEAFLERDALTANYILMLNLSKLNLNPFYNIQHLTTSLELKKVLTSQWNGRYKVWQRKMQK